MRNKNSSPELCIRLMGGLGNQLFQYAAGLHFAYINQAELFFDTSEANLRREKDGSLPIFQLGTSAQIMQMWNVSDRGFSQRFIGLSLRLSLRPMKFLPNVSSRIVLVLGSLIVSLKSKKFISLIAPRNLGFTDIEKGFFENSYLVGYFQTYRYAQNPIVFEKLKSLGQSSGKVQEIARTMSDKPLVVHVRRGDYLLESNFGTLDTSYYSRAIESQLLIGNYRDIWVFSDDIQAAKSIIPIKHHKMATWFDPDFFSATETLELMRMGGGYIIANSSLSWWGAFLSHAGDPHVIAPEPWFIGLTEPRDLVPPTWERLRR